MIIIKRLKKSVISVVSFFLGRALPAAVRLDENVRHETTNWKDGFTIAIQAYNDGPCINFVKEL